MSARFRRPHHDREDSLALEIQAVLEDDLANGAPLMLPKYRAEALRHQTLDGYCTIGAEAYFFLGGEREAGLQPMQLTRDGSHWWILKDARTVIDLTLRPGERTNYPYAKGGPRGFMMHGYRRPSERAKKLIARVKRNRNR